MAILPGALGPTLARHLTYKKPFLVTVDKVSGSFVYIVYG